MENLQHLTHTSFKTDPIRNNIQIYANSDVFKKIYLSLHNAIEHLSVPPFNPVDI